MEKKIVKGFVVVLFVLVLIKYINFADALIVRKGQVFSVENHVVCIVDNTGNVWEWEEESEEFKEGQNVKMLMNNNHTEDTIEDDKIVKIVIDK